MERFCGVNFGALKLGLESLFLKACLLLMAFYGFYP